MYDVNSVQNATSSIRTVVVDQHTLAAALVGRRELLRHYLRQTCAHDTHGHYDSVPELTRNSPEILHVDVYPGRF